MTLVPDLAAPIAGWRVWNVADRGRGPELVSPVRPVPWPHRVPTTAVCAGRRHPSPAPGCRCGLYATATIGLAALGHHTGATVLGCAALWGRVVEHTDGWRGEHGYPLVLFVLPEVPGVAEISIRRLRRRRPTVPAPDELGSREVGSTETLSRELARLYAVPVHPAPGMPDARFANRGRLAGRADAVRTEAAAGLAGRRSGDPGSVDRLARCVQDLLDSIGR